MKNLYVEILKFGKNQIQSDENGFTRDDLEKHLRSIGFEVGNIVNIQYFLDNSFQAVRSPPNLYKIKPTGIEYLIDFEELEQARASSKSAMFFAVSSLLVAILTSVISIFISYNQLSSETVINRAQVDIIKNEISLLRKETSSALLNLTSHFPATPASSARGIER